MFDYLEKEIGATVYHEPIQTVIHGKSFFIGHGDGLGPGDHGYKFIKKVFRNPICQWLFARLHPNFGIGLANYFSRSSRAANTGEDQFYGEEEEWLLQYSCRKSEQLPAVEYFIFGHRHLPINYGLPNGKSRYINLGEWVNFNSYAVFNGEALKLHFFEHDAEVISGNMNSNR